MEVLEFLEKYGSWGSYTLIVFGLIYAVNYLLKENKSLRLNEKVILERHYDDLKEMGSVVEKVSKWVESNTKYGGD